MRYVRKAEFFARLRKRYPFDSRYFYSGRVSRLPERRLSTRAGIDRLVRETLRVFTWPVPGAILAFNDGFAGWRGVPRRRRHDPLQLEPGFDLRAFLQEHVCFRDPDGYADNYYFTSPELKWFVVFCHEGDWHFMGPSPFLRKT